MQEVTEAITKLNSSKSVGRDQITAEIITANQSRITPILRQLYNNCAINNAMPKNWTGGIITFLRKKSAADNLDNYRPFTLIDIIYI